METFLHVYQRTSDKGVFLYRVQERIMLYTIFYTVSRSRKISITALAFMFTHVHALIQNCSPSEGKSFMGKVLSTFARELNQDSGRTGGMFGRASCSLKRNGKAIRSSVAYVYNNSVEKKLYSRAIEDRWDFLAYAMSDNPFSERIIIRKLSSRMRKSIRAVNDEYNRGCYLRLQRIRCIFKGLSGPEAQQLIDYIIVKYKFIDYGLSVNYFKDFDSMVTAIESNTGSEYEIKEDFEIGSDRPYVQMCAFAKRHGLLNKDMRIYKLTEDDKVELAQLMSVKANASPHQIFKFIHTERKPQYPKNKQITRK